MEASPPYNPNLAADVVLRTCDDVDFYVLGSLLRFVSPVFMDMYILNHGPAAEESEKKDDRPLIRLEEDSSTLRLLLDTIYPRANDPPLTDVSLFWKVGKASKKYIMDIVEERLQNWIISSKLISTDSLRIYTIAIDLGWEGVAIEAARKTLGTPLEKLGYVEELRSIPASGFYRFLEYRLRCDTSASPHTEILMEPYKSGTTVPQNLRSDMDADTPTDAQEPFNSSKEADLILRSSDAVNFFVLKPLIHLVSPDFNELFPSLHETLADGKCLIHITQDSKVLYQLLSIIYYYIDEPDIHNFQLYRAVAEAAKDYKMTVIEKRLRKLILTSPLIKKEPLKVYVLATVLHWEDVAKLAAINTLTLPLQEMTYIEEFDRITGEDLYRLVNFRLRCGEVACRCLEADSNFQQYGPNRWRYIFPMGGGVPYQYESAQEEQYQKVKASPRGSTLLAIYASEFETLQNSFRNRGGYYSNSMSAESAFAAVKGIMRCWTDMVDAVEVAVSAVPLHATHLPSQ